MPTQLVFWIATSISLCSLLFMIYAFRSKANADAMAVLTTRVNALEGRIDKVEDRATRIEGTIEHLPNKDTAHSIELRVSDLSGQVGRLAEQLKPVTAMAARIQEVLIERASHS